MRKYLFILLIILATACSGPLEATPRPTPEAVFVAHTPSARPVREALNACANAHPEIALVVEEIPAGFIDLEEVDLALRLGEPDEMPNFAAPLAGERILIITHPSNDILDQLNADDLEAIFSGRFRQWSKVGGEELAIQVWAAPEGDEVRRAFVAAWPEGGSVTPLANLAPDPSAMLEAVSADPAAIGFLPQSWATGEVRTLELGLTLPVLTLSAQEPEGAARILMLCLQGPQGQEVLGEYYSAWDGR